jgi:hypothetical protein
MARLKNNFETLQNRIRLKRLTAQIQKHSHPRQAAPGVVFFNASTRIQNLSLNAAFDLLTSYSFRLAGLNCFHFACREGMSHCVLGTDRTNFSSPPPCSNCISQSEKLYQGTSPEWFGFSHDRELAKELESLGIAGLSEFKYPVSIQGSLRGMPVGEIVLPSARWALRKYTLNDDEPTRYLLREYIQSAVSVAVNFDDFLQRTSPDIAIIFNGILFPEAAARWVAHEINIRVMTFEVGFQPQSAFFTFGEATAYPVQIPDGFQLDSTKKERLASYRENRTLGNFTMAGIRFWPEMKSLGEEFAQKSSRFEQIVTVFTNVAYDTSQVHANKVFPHMFAWLEKIKTHIANHPETLFVIRAHPDEIRLGTRKISNQTVSDWIEEQDLIKYGNVIFISPVDFVSSYELVNVSKFVIVYNSSIGLEAVLLGKPVICGGKARYTQYPIVEFPQTQEAFTDLVEIYLEMEQITFSEEYRVNAGRFLYYQLFKTSLPFDKYIQPGSRRGYVNLKSFSWNDLLPENSPTMQILLEAVTSPEQFILEHGSSATLTIET